MQIVDTIMDSVKATALLDPSGRTIPHEGPVDYPELFLIQHMAIQFAAGLLKSVAEGASEYLVKSGRAKSFKTSGAEDLA